MPAELVYLEPIRTTVRRRGPSESYRRGRRRRHDDDRPGAAARGRRLPLGARGTSTRGCSRTCARPAGRVYRTQGLGYVLRRTAGGHTWDSGLGYFLTRSSLAAQWRGFRPSELLEIS